MVHKLGDQRRKSLKREGVNSMRVFKKRGRWCVRDGQSPLRKFSTEQEALEFAGIAPVVEKEDEGYIAGVDSIPEDDEEFFDEDEDIFED